MKTGEEMYQYCWDNKYGVGASKKWGIKHFDLIADALDPDENVLMCMIGMKNKNDGTYAFAFTDKRIIMAKQNVIGSGVQSINYDYVNDVSMRKTLTQGYIEMDTMKEKFTVTLPIQTVAAVNDSIHQVLNQVQNKTAAPAGQTSAADEILKYKNLLDMGAITQNEYDQKKRELLGS